MSMFDINCVIDDDSNESAWLPPPGCDTGFDYAGRGAAADSDGYAYGGVADPFPDDQLVDPADFQATIEEQEQQQSGVYHVMRRNNLKAKDQDGLSYCWVYAPTACIEIDRCVQNEVYVELAPESVGGPITGYKNVGGWGKAALQFIADKGVAPRSLWAWKSLNHSLYTDAVKAAALDYRATEWWELKPRSVQHAFTAVMKFRKPVSIGLNWWSHQVNLVGFRWKNGGLVGVIRNQWQGWGDDNYAELSGSKLIPDDAVCPRAVVAS